MLAGVEEVGIGSGFFGALRRSCQPVDGALHWKNVAKRVGWKKALLVDCLRGQALVGGVDTAEDARVKMGQSESRRMHPGSSCVKATGVGDKTIAGGRMVAVDFLFFLLTVGSRVGGWILPWGRWRRRKLVLGMDWL